MLKNILIGAVSLLFLPTLAYANQSETAFSQLKTLAGNWKKVDAKNDTFQIEFSLVANETVLVETWKYNGKDHSLTLYHLDGDSLIATHYCPQGNQPRLKMQESSTTNQITFQYFDATNLTSPKQSHQHSLAFDFTAQAENIIRHESYLSDGKLADSSMAITRVIQ